MSTRDRYAIEGLTLDFDSGREFYRAICEVCDRRGHSGFMGYLFVDPDSPDEWVWYNTARRLNKTEERNPLRGWEERRFGRVGILNSWTASDAPLKPRCNAKRPHHLAVMDSADIIDLLGIARAEGQGSVRIPE